MAEDFLRRWSRLKHAQAAEKPAEKKDPPAENEQEQAPLPSLDTMTPDSDFSAFMQPKVEDALRRAALKKLFSDPRFNIPDPFEAYSGDWTGGEPISEEMLATLNQARTLLFSDKKDVTQTDVTQADVTQADVTQADVTQTEETQTEETQPEQPQAEEKPREDEPRRQDA